MVKGLGTDIIEIGRIEKAIDRYGQKFLDRIFTPDEQSYCLQNVKSARNFAGRFAAKEAVAKALGTGIGKNLKWTDLEILNDAAGKPDLTFTPEAAKRLGSPQILLTISHCKEFATAVAIIL